MGDGDLLDHIDHAHVDREILFRIARIVEPVIAFGQIRTLADQAGQEAAAQRAVGDEADAEILAQRQDLLLHPALPERIFALQRGDRMRGVGAADGVGACLRKAEIAHLAFFDEPRHRPDRLLDRHIGVDAVLVVQVDRIDAEAL